MPEFFTQVAGEDGKLEAVVRDTARVASEQIKGLSTQVGGAGLGLAGRAAVRSLQTTLAGQAEPNRGLSSQVAGFGGRFGWLAHIVLASGPVAWVLASL